MGSSYLTTVAHLAQRLAWPTLTNAYAALHMLYGRQKCHWSPPSDTGVDAHIAAAGGQ